MLRQFLGLAAMLATLATPIAVGASAAPSWTVYADCAAAYLANARLADPNRPASMTAQVSDVADDYLAAAAKRYRRAHAASAATARRVVKDRMDRQASIYGGQAREVVEHVIDACPQTGD